MKEVRDDCISQTEALRVQCNLDYSFRYFKLSIFFHNSKNYNGHLMRSKANEMNERFELEEKDRDNNTTKRQKKHVLFLWLFTTYK